MNTYLTIEALPGAPIACDMTAADDTPEERLAEYGRVFAHALIGRDRTTDSTVFRFAAKPGVREWIIDLVTREAACCRFLTYRISGDDGQLEWTTSMVSNDRYEAQAMLDEFYAAPDWASQGPDVIAGRLEQRGFTFVGADGTEGYPFAGAELHAAQTTDRG